jgi:glycosyltransferase involved in cell wall biosynthesis
MKLLRVVHVVSVDKPNYYLNNLVEFSEKEKVEFLFVTFASEDSPFVKDVKERGSKVIALGREGRSQYPRNYAALSKIIRHEDPNIVHTHLFDPSLIGLTVAKRQERKTVLTRHHSDAIHEIPSAAKRRFYLGLENYISRKSDHIIAPSRMVRNFLVDKEGVSENKVSIIPYGQTTERFDAVTSEKVEATRRSLGMDRNVALVCVSRLFHRKGHIYLFEALSGLVSEGLDATLYLVGDGDFRPELESAAEKLGISNRVVFLGWRDDALAIMAAADVIVHPSLEDALSSAVIESLMLERPIVATDISGVRDSLDDGKYGVIVKPADASDFRMGLRSILDDMAAAKRNAKAGRLYLLDYMDAKRVADQHLEIYRQLAK